MRWLGFILFSFYVSAQGSPLYSFDQALKIIMDRHTVVKVQETKVEAADWVAFGKKAAFLPQVSLSASQTNINNSASAPSQFYGGSASLNLFRWGADYLSWDGAKSDLASQRNTLNDVKLTAEQEAVEVLSQVIEKQQTIEILVLNVAAFKNYLDIAHQRFDRGLLPQQEVDKVSIDFANAEARLKDAQSQLAQAQGNLERLLGPGEIAPQWPWKDKIVNTSVLSHFNVHDRPDVKAAEDLLSAEESRMAADKRRLFPSLDFSFSPGVSQTQGGGSYSASTTLSLSMPLFNSFQDYTTYKTQYQIHAARDLQLRQLKMDGEAQWKSSQKKLILAIATAKAREKTLDVSQKIYAANQLRFKQGRASANDLALDLARLIDSQLLAVQGWSGAHKEFTQYCHTLGRSLENCNN